MIIIEMLYRMKFPHITMPGLRGAATNTGGTFHGVSRQFI
jgi:hypothetical protein